ncbi:MAG: hypothetical protein M1814_003218 [Vezdaea aestivalis]|nr:MAG: hypothetical protein M1814_003218 [Vezdaea aestivalis]
MADPVSKARANLLDDQYGSSFTSNSSQVRYESDQGTDSPARNLALGADLEHEGSNTLRRRRSSLSMRIDTLRHVGGVNSIDSFARSWQRAAGFADMRSSRPSFVFSADGDQEQHNFQRRDEESSPQERRSLLREQLQMHGSPDAAVEDDVQDLETSQDSTSLERELPKRGPLPNDSGLGIFAASPYGASPFGASVLGTSYGTLSSRINKASMRHANELWREQQETDNAGPHKEREPLIVKQVEQDDGRMVNVVVGRSTLPQTVFNSVNVLIGIGLLSLPLGIKYSGWIVGMIFLFLAAVTTAYTAKILAKCLDVDGTLITFADIAYVAYGPRARLVTSLIFIVELLAACVALIILFAVSLDGIIPGYGRPFWAIVCGMICLPINFMPLRILSFTSILGILSTFSSRSKF